MKGTCLREGLIKLGGLLNRGSLFRVEPIRREGPIKERVLLERQGRLLTSGRLIRQRYHLNKWCFSKRGLAEWKELIARGLSERGLTRVGEWAYWRGGLLEMRVVLDREGGCLFGREA